MALFNSSKWDDIIYKQLLMIDERDKQIADCFRKLEKCQKCKPNPVHLALTISIKNSKFIIMALEIAANQFSVGALSLIDSNTGAPVTATFDSTTAVSDNPAAATASVNADGTVTITGVAAGTSSVTVTTNASFTNSLGNASTSSVNTVIPITVDAVQTADGVTLVVTFGAPQQQ